MTLIPAYGRDYKSAKAVKEDFASNKDFQVADMSSAYNGRYVNREDLSQSNIEKVNIRYNNLRSLTLVKV